MKISFIYPDNGVYPDNKNWMWWVAEGLERKGHTVLLNEVDKDCDVILGMTISKIHAIKRAHSLNPGIPLIVYNWDMQPELQPLVGRWDQIGWDKLMEDSIDVWTQTEYHKNLAEKMSGVKHFKMPICALDFEFEVSDPGEYAIMASRRVPYKRFDLFEGACKLANIPFISRHPDMDNREDYVKDLQGCKVLVIASEEESNTPMSGYEAAFCGKPLLLSDIPVHREEWGDNAIYFRNGDMGDLAQKLSDIYAGKFDDMGDKAFKHAIGKYTVQHFVDRIDNRICQLLS